MTNSNVLTHWLAEFDRLDTDWNTTTFAVSGLGRLPVELLRIIICYIPVPSLPAPASVGPCIRTVVDESLYTCIDLSQNQLDNDSHSSSLYRTLVSCPQLAQMVSKFAATVHDIEAKMDLPMPVVFPGGLHSAATIKASVPQLAVTGQIIQQRLPNLKDLSLAIIKNNYLLASNPLEKLFPGFDSTTAHLLPSLGSNIVRLSYTGAEFHWILARFPRLQELYIQRACTILPDGAPDQVNSSVTSLGVLFRSEILTIGDQPHALTPLLAHFPQLDKLRVTVLDHKHELGSIADIDVTNPGNYDPLVQKLASLACSLTSLDLGACMSDESNGNVFLHHVQPCNGFLMFKSLKNLVVPYQCLLGPAFARVDEFPAPASILPPTLVRLEVHCTHLEFYDWLMRIRNDRRQLCYLSDVRLECHSAVGDDYTEVALIHSPHPVLEVLQEFGISLSIGYGEQESRVHWDLYDMKAMDILNWIESLTT